MLACYHAATVIGVTATRSRTARRPASDLADLVFGADEGKILAGIDEFVTLRALLLLI
jgi:hypothetical protein